MAKKINYSFFITDDSEFFQDCISKGLDASKALNSIMKLQTKEMSKKFSRFEYPTQFQIGIYVPSDSVHDMEGVGYCEIKTKFDDNGKFMNSLYFDDTLLSQSLDRLNYDKNYKVNNDYMNALKELVSVAESEGIKLEKNKSLEKAINL